MTFRATDQVWVLPQQAAERLTDIAYALVAGGSLELHLDHERVLVPLGDEFGLEVDLTSDGERHQLTLRLSWSARES